MTAAEKPGDPADRATDAKADGAFGGLTNHRGGYGDDKLTRLIDWLRKRPDMTLASGEGGLLLAEIDRLSQMNEDVQKYHVGLHRRADRAERILAALRKPNEAVVDAALNEYRRRYCHGPLLILHKAYHSSSLTEALSAAVAAAEREVDA